jgi:hypothetical protein
MKKYIIPLIVLFLAAVVIGLDYSFGTGLAGSGLTIAAGFPLLSIDFDGETNLPGIARGYVALCADIDTEAVPVASPATALEKITIVGSHSMESQKYFVKMYSTLGKGTLDFKAGGTRDFENFAIEGALFYPCTKADALALSTALLGQDVIVILEQNSDDLFFLQVGNKKLPARIVAEGSWGTELNGEKGISFKLSAFHGKATPYIYTGSIALSGETVTIS